MTDAGAAPRSARRCALIALAATGFVAPVVVAVLVFRSGDGGGAPAGAPGDDGVAVMALHDAPRELPELRYIDESGKVAQQLKAGTVRVNTYRAIYSDSASGRVSDRSYPSQ